LAENSKLIYIGTNADFICGKRAWKVAFEKDNSETISNSITKLGILLANKTPLTRLKRFNCRC
jgi:hypothetical protein